MNNISLHIDCWSPCATNPVWRGLNSLSKNVLKNLQRNTENGNDIFIDLVNFLKPDVLLIPNSFYTNITWSNREDITNEFNSIISRIYSIVSMKCSSERIQRQIKVFYDKSNNLYIITGPNYSGIPFRNEYMDELFTAVRKRKGL